MKRSGRRPDFSPLWDLLVPCATGIVAYLLLFFGAITPAKEELPAFFGIMMQILATVLVALALVTVLPARTAYLILRPISILGLAWICIGMGASILGSLDLESSPFQPALLSVVLSSSAVFLAVVLRVAARNLRDQNRAAEIELAKGPGPRVPPAR